MFIKKYGGPVNPYALPGLLNDYKMNLRDEEITEARLMFFLRRLCEDAGITKEQVMDTKGKNGKNGKAEVSEVRHLFSYFAKELTDFNYGKIGTLLGGKDRTTVMHSVATVRGYMKYDDKFREKVKRLEGSLKGYEIPREELAYEVIGKN